jgi:hypothetical protein
VNLALLTIMPTPCRRASKRRTGTCFGQDKNRLPDYLKLPVRANKIVGKKFASSTD